MINRIEKLSFLSETLNFARTDNRLEEIEYDLLLAVTKQLELTAEDFTYLLDHRVKNIDLKSHSERERIVRFHRLLMMMPNLDKEVRDKKLFRLYNFGLRMGLNHEAIKCVLNLMDNFQNNAIPLYLVNNIFKIQHN